MPLSAAKMNILWIILWSVSICQAKYVPGNKVACLDKGAWRMPDWDLPTTDFIQRFTEDNRPWRHPLIQLILDNQTLGDNVTLPEPLLPTKNENLLRLYDKAMRVLAKNEEIPKKDRELAKDRFDQDRACYAYGVQCETSSWMTSWPSWSCENSKKKSTFAQARASRDLDELTLSLLKRANRYALLNLARRLACTVDDQPIQENDSSPFKKRSGNEDDQPLPNLNIPKFAQNVESLVRFYTNPVHRAEHRDVREPHLPGHVAAPIPLFSWLVAEPAPVKKQLSNLYKNALKAYDEDAKLSDTQLRRRWNQHMDDSWDWIVQDPCYYDRDSCNMYDRLSRIFNSGFYGAHEEKGKELKKAMEHAGLARLGLQLVLENVKNKGSRESLEELLDKYS